MKQLVCEMCGSTELVKQGGVFVCQNCGTSYSVEEAKKMMVEGTVDVQGTVKVDNSDFIERYLRNARRAKEKTDWEEVEKYYNLVEQNDPENIEAIFYSSYGKAMLSLTEDSDRFKRQQRFDVFGKSISVIDDYYDVRKSAELKPYTLTYGPDRGRSPPELAADFKAFWHRLHYHYPDTEYLVVYEPCQDGRFHAHMLLKQTNAKPLFIPKEQLDRLWGHGMTHVGRIRSVRATALYLCKMANDKQRISYLPAGFRVYRRSRGIVKPEAQRMTRGELETFAKGNGYVLDHADSLAIVGSDSNGREVCLNTITHEQFKRGN